MLIASALITLLAMMMLKYKGYEEKWRAKLENASQAQVFSYFTAHHNATKLPSSTMQLVICYAVHGVREDRGTALHAAH